MEDPHSIKNHKFADLIAQLVGLAVKLQLEGSLPEEMEECCTKIKDEIDRRLNVINKRLEDISGKSI